jgi:iron complex outermembrane receptor protein
VTIFKGTFGLACLLAASHSSWAMEGEIEELIIVDRLFEDTTVVSPTSKIEAKDLQSINLLTTEDAVAFEPSLVIRRRYVGDPNGTMGIRGSGMFQTARSMVFSDGLPLHYLLQTRWSGAPRWSLVAPGEIDNVEVIYGPFSAAYGGNSMGGVVNIKTRIPEERLFVLQGTLMGQNYDVLATNETFGGSQWFASYEDRWDDFSIYATYNHFDNKSQPMSNYMLAPNEGSGQSLEDLTTDLDNRGIKGYFQGQNDRSGKGVYIGDSGSETSISDLYKIKLGYDFGELQLRGTIAYEDRERKEDDKKNYLRDIDDNVYWSSDTGSRNFDERGQIRKSLLLGVGASGIISDNWFFDVYATDFDIIKDRETRSGLNPFDPNFGTRNGRLTKHGDTGWQTFDLKFGTERLLGNEDMRLSLGYYTDSYQLEIQETNIDALSGTTISERGRSGGETASKALFAQWGWSFDPQWDLALGLRYEDWESISGYKENEMFDDRTEDKLSPKLSIAYSLTDSFSIRYSLAKANRFAIVEELFSNESSTTNIIVSDPSLKPEIGIHHNLTFNHEREGGYIRINLFYDIVEDTIFNQSGTIFDNGTQVNVSTFLSIDEVKTVGIEFVLNQSHVLGSRLNMRFNTSYIQAEITKNKVNTTVEGNRVPRIPERRANLILSYPLFQSVDASTSFRYASNSFSDLDNGDTKSEVYGAIDSYLFVGAKLNWKISDTTNVSFGVDNLFDDLAYVAHPWPSRTFYLEGKLTF